MGKIERNIVCLITFFPRKSYRLWDNVEKYGTARQATEENVIWLMRFACWIIKATNTHSEYVILIDFPLKQWFLGSASVFDIHTLPVLLISVFVS
jgi:hypothetical protein